MRCLSVHPCIRHKCHRETNCLDKGGSLAGTRTTKIESYHSLSLDCRMAQMEHSRMLLNRKPMETTLSTVEGQGLIIRVAQRDSGHTEKIDWTLDKQSAVMEAPTNMKSCTILDWNTTALNTFCRPGSYERQVVASVIQGCAVSQRQLTGNDN